MTKIYNKGYLGALEIRAAINAGDMKQVLCYFTYMERRLSVQKDWEAYKEAFDQGWAAWDQKPVLRKKLIKGYAAQKRRAAFKVIDGGPRS
jgi:hypothetical protein